jgi:hypothetical protein
MWIKLFQAKCVRCPCGVTDGLRGKNVVASINTVIGPSEVHAPAELLRWPLFLLFFFFIIIIVIYYSFISPAVTFFPEGVVLGL